MRLKIKPTIKCDTRQFCKLKAILKKPYVIK